MVVDMHQADIDRFIHAMGAECYVSRDAVVEAVSAGGSFNVIHIPTAVKVDIFVAGSDAFDRERLTRRIPVTFSDGDDRVALFVDTAENTILRKLEWYRRGGETSERQWRDVTAVVNTQASRLDQAHLRVWATQLGVEDLLARALRDSGS